MAHNTTATSYFGSGEIKFGQLRDTFGFSRGRIKASQLLRSTDPNLTNPNVPDATENANIQTSTESQWKASHFRNSITEYIITQSGTDVNLTLSSLSWNSNLNKNVKKTYEVTGTIGGTTSGGSALTLDGTVYNLTVRVSGYVLGHGGVGGVFGSTETQGEASSTVTANIRIDNNSKDTPSTKLVVSGSGNATIQMYAGMRDGSNADKRPWRYIYFDDNNGTQSVYVDPGESGSSSDRALDFYVNLSVTGGNEYNITPTNLQKRISQLKNYGTNTTTLPSGSIVSGYSMRDADNDICRGQLSIGQITQGTQTVTIGSGKATDGGHAINANTTGNRVRIIETSYNRIRGGGGGGGSGKRGTDGTGGTCDTYDLAVDSRTQTNRCRVSNMDSDRAKEICQNLGYLQFSRTNSSDCCKAEKITYCVKKKKNGECKETATKDGKCLEWYTYVYCWNNYTTSGGTAGNGGNGGNGRGYNWNQLDGSDDKPIAAPGLGEAGGPTEGTKGGGCNAKDGTAGTKGGDGGAWGRDGYTGAFSGNGGKAGSRIIGTNWSY